MAIAIFWHREGFDVLTNQFVRYSDHSRVAETTTLEKDFLDLCRTDAIS
jgi:hypothetical protein